MWRVIETHRPERFREFHSAMFEGAFELAFADAALGHDYWIIVDGGRRIGGLQRAAGRTGAPVAGTQFYVEVDDLDGALASVMHRGGFVERSRTELGDDDRWIGTFRDPTSVSFGLWTPHSRHPRTSGSSRS